MSARASLTKRPEPGAGRLVLHDCPEDPLVVCITLGGASVRVRRTELQALREQLAQAEARLRMRESRALRARNYELF